MSKKLLPFDEIKNRPGNYCEIYSSQKAIEWALLSADGEVCAPFAQCKDYSQDTIGAFLNKKSAHIYGLNWTYGKHPAPSLDPLLIAIKYSSNPKFTELVVEAPKMLRILEKRSKIPLAGRTKMEMIGNTAVFISPPDWWQNPALLSLWFLLVRLSVFIGPDVESLLHGKVPAIHPSTDEPGRRMFDNDISYWKQATPAIMEIFHKGLQAFVDTDLYNLSTGELHNQTGIVNGPRRKNSKFDLKPRTWEKIWGRK